jgi:hypothetical protein
MFRKLILSAVLATGTVTGLTLSPAAADAHPPAEVRHDRFDRHDQRDHRDRHEIRQRFEVLYSRGGCWENGGSYADRCDADRAAEHYRCEGCRVEVRPC